MRGHSVLTLCCPVIFDISRENRKNTWTDLRMSIENHIQVFVIIDSFLLIFPHLVHSTKLNQLWPFIFSNICYIVQQWKLMLQLSPTFCLSMHNVFSGGKQRHTMSCYLRFTLVDIQKERNTRLSYMTLPPRRQGFSCYMTVQYF